MPTHPTSGSGASMAKLDLPYVQAFVDRHGRTRRYFRRSGWPTVPLPDDMRSEAFLTAYTKALTADRPAPRSVSHPRSLDSLIAKYYRTADFRALDAGTQRNYKFILERFRDEHGDLLTSTVRRGDIAAILDARAATPAAARNLRKRLNQLFDYAIELEWIAANPSRATKPPKAEGDGFRAWEEEDIAQFEEAYPIGSKERLALALLLYTGQRRSDVAGMGRQHVKDDKIHVVQFKGRKRSPVRLAIPIHPILRAAIDAAPTDQMSFVMTAFGKPFSHAGFTNWFSAAAEKAGLPAGCTPHGLRKAASRRLAEAGCTTHQIAAITGHKSLKEVERYTKSASQSGLAESAMATLRERQLSNQSVKPKKTSINS